MRRGLLFWIIVAVLVFLIVCVFGSVIFGLHISRHHGSATVGVGGSSATLGVSGGQTQTATTAGGSVAQTGPGNSSNTNRSSTNVTLGNNPWPGPQNGAVSGLNAVCPSGNDQVNVVVDLNDVVHDGEDAHFSFTALNCTGRTIQFSRATVALGLDGMRYMQMPVTDLSSGVDYLGSDGSWIATGSLAPGQTVAFDGKIQMPVRGFNGWRTGASVACLKGDLQQVYVGKPNATDKADNVSAASCSEFNAS